ALALPLIEVGLSIFRRFLRNQPIFSADRGHIHHRLLDRGFTPRRAALMLYAVCGVGATLSLLQGVLHNLPGAVVLLFAGCDFVDISQEEGAAEQPVLVIPFAEILRRVLPVRLEQICSASASLANLAAAVEDAGTTQAAPRNSSTRTVISSDCAAPSVNPVTA